MNRSAWRREVKTSTVIYEANRITAAKLNDGLANPNCLASSVPTIPSFQFRRAANAHSSHKSASLDTFRPNASSTQHRLLLLSLSPLPQTPHRPPPPSPPTALSLLRRRRPHPTCPNVCIDRSVQHQHPHHDITH
nr:unnamed protein product [Spirometra erinaceieuropaei]